MDTKKQFLFSIYYETWDQESLEIGETDEKGIIVDDEKGTLMDLADYVYTYGPIEYCDGYSETVSFWFVSCANEDIQSGNLTYHHLFVHDLDGKNISKSDFETVNKIVMGEISYREVSDTFNE